ncbi:MAG: hypothetical protein AAF318_20010 [Pseudomonadota bacterium]
MGALTVSQVEGVPAAWPEPAWAWQRMEAWVSHRWSEREVVWIVEGPGEWTPPLRPATSFTAERWNGEGWVAAGSTLAPLGGLELPCGTFRVAATVGDDSAPPAAVTEAIARLVAFAAQAPAGLRSYSVGDVEAEIEPKAASRALHLCGAGDLLKPWRKPR